METNDSLWQVPKPRKSVVKWLLDSDPAIRWQVMRDIDEEPDKIVAAQRSLVATEGWVPDSSGYGGTRGIEVVTLTLETAVYHGCGDRSPHPCPGISIGAWHVPIPVIRRGD